MGVREMERWRERVRVRELMRQRGGKKRLDRLPCQTSVDLDVSGMEMGLVKYIIWAKESGTDGIEAGEQEEEGEALILLIYCHNEASPLCLCYYDTAGYDIATSHCAAFQYKQAKPSCSRLLLGLAHDSFAL